MCVNDSSTTVNIDFPWNTANLLLGVFGQQLEAQRTSATNTQQTEQMFKLPGFKGTTSHLQSPKPSKMTNRTVRRWCLPSLLGGGDKPRKQQLPPARGTKDQDRQQWTAVSGGAAVCSGGENLHQERDAEVEPLRHSRGVHPLSSVVLLGSNDQSSRPRCTGFTRNLQDSLLAREEEASAGASHPVAEASDLTHQRFVRFHRTFLA